MIEYCDKYLVFDSREIRKYLDQKDQIMLNIIQNKIKMGRLTDGLEATKEYLVIDSAKPYYGKIKDTVEMEEYFLHY